MKQWLDAACEHQDIYFGVVASWNIDMTGNIVIDAATANSIRTPIDRYINTSEFGWGDFELMTVSIRIHIDLYRQLFGFGNNQLTTRWKKLQITRNATQANAELYFHNNAENVYSVRIDLIEAIPAPLNAILNNFSIASDIPDAEENDVLEALQIDAAELVAVYDVGQANCNAVCNSAGKPLLYFDFGWPLRSHHHTAPIFPNFCYQGQPPVILSHWHEDHYGGLMQSPLILNSKWIAPRQKVMPSVLNYWGRLIPAGNLLFLNRSIATRNLNLLQCTGASKNSSGLALLVNGEILLPGDANYRFIPLGNVGQLSGLVASHHGGRSRHIPAGMGGKLVYSVGANNHYNHPTPGMPQSYWNRGWHYQVSTSNRAVSYVGCPHTIGYGHAYLPLVHNLAGPICPTVTRCNNGCIVQCNLGLLQ